MAPWRSRLCILPFLVSDRSHYRVLPGDAWSSSAKLITKTPRFSWGKGLGYFQAAGLSQSSAQASKQLLIPAGLFLKWPRFLSAPVLRKRLSLCPPARCRGGGWALPSSQCCPCLCSTDGAWGCPLRRGSLRDTVGSGAVFWSFRRIDCLGDTFLKGPSFFPNSEEYHVLGTTCQACCCSVTKWCLTLCNPMACSTPGLDSGPTLI